MVPTGCALLLIACNQLIWARIAVTSLRSSTSRLVGKLTASLCGEDRSFYAVDLLRNFRAVTYRWSELVSAPYSSATCDASFGICRSCCHDGPSNSPSKARLGSTFSSHIDGGHSDKETYDDLRLCQSILFWRRRSMIISMNWPGVGEGAIGTTSITLGHFVPAAVGFNKVVLQKTPGPSTRGGDPGDVPRRRKRTIEILGRPTFLFEADLTKVFDVDVSTPQELVRRLRLPRPGHFKVGSQSLRLGR
jgi:hypothetical protein